MKLKWEKRLGRQRWDCVTDGAKQYYIEGTKTKCAYREYFWSFDPEVIGCYDSLAEAKKAVQKHFDKYPPGSLIYSPNARV